MNENFYLLVFKSEKRRFKNCINFQSSNNINKLMSFPQILRADGKF